MLFPKLIAAGDSAQQYVIFVDTETEPWPTLAACREGFHPQQSVEWGIAPQTIGQDAEELESAASTFNFRFDARTGELYTVEIPSQLLRDGFRDQSTPPTPSTASSNLVADLDFWVGAKRIRERAVRASVAVKLTGNSVMLEFGNDVRTWTWIHPQVAVATSSMNTIAGVYCKSSEEDVRKLLRP